MKHYPFILLFLVAFVSCKSNENTTNTVKSTTTVKNSPNGREGGNRPPNKGERLSPDELFKQMDLNKDNKLSKDEVKGPLKNDFDKLDNNKDGFLTKDELPSSPPPRR
ncbi:MAG: hypothetical protein ACI85I_002807 [Arenicella sp.]|jgi:hypothetical protein